MSRRPVVLIGAEKYLPGFKAGGPIRSISNLVEQLGDEFDFRIVTEDRDRDDNAPYPDVALRSWIPVGKARVYYAPKGELVRGGFGHVVADVGPDLVFLNSLLWSVTVVYLLRRRFRGEGAVPVLLAPRGELDPGALSIRSVRKQIFLGVARALSLFRDVTWQASTTVESTHIADHIPRAPIEIAPNVTAPPPARPRPLPHKEPGSSRFVFLSRVGPKKNLPHLLVSLRHVHGDVSLDIYGRKIPSEWRVVESLLGDGLDHVDVTDHGAVGHDRVESALEQAHFLALPTLAENFGHAIYEALRLGRPVVISDRTPWRNLAEQHAGWDLPLDAEQGWVDTLQRCIDMDDDEYRRWTAGAHAYARRWYETSGHAEDQAAVFRKVME